MALPLSWVDRIFDKLMLTYGRDFMGRWDGLPMASVKADWAHELSGFEEHPESIKHALLSVNPAKSPTVLEFRNLAANAPKMADKALPLPPQNMKFVNSVLAGVDRNRAPVGMKDWAHRLQARHDAGDRLNGNQIRCYRAALGLDGVAA